MGFCFHGSPHISWLLWRSLGTPLMSTHPLQAKEGQAQNCLRFLNQNMKSWPDYRVGPCAWFSAVELLLPGNRSRCNQHRAPLSFQSFPGEGEFTGAGVSAAHSGGYFQHLILLFLQIQHKLGGSRALGGNVIPVGWSSWSPKQYLLEEPGGSTGEKLWDKEERQSGEGGYSSHF